MSMPFGTSRSLLGLWLIVGLSACTTEESPEGVDFSASDRATDSQDSDLQSRRSKPADSFPADVAVQVGVTTANVVRLSKLSPPAASRVFGYVGVALHEAIVPGIEGEVSFASRLKGLAPPPRLRLSRNVDWRLAAAFAGTLVLGKLVSDPVAKAAADNAYASLRAELEARGLDSETTARTEAYAQAVADIILARAGEDGFEGRGSRPYLPPKGDIAWVPTENQAPALEPGWGGLQPWTMPAGNACLPGAPPAYATEAGSAFRREAEAVYEASRSLTASQREIALYWADGPGATSTPPGHWWELAVQLAVERRLDLAETARLFGALGVTVADSFISCWNAKYTYGVLRPETYIQRTLDASWKPLLVTPPFPEYSSGHSTVSSAASEVMSAFFGAETPFTDRVHVALGMTPRTFGSFEEAAKEAASSRLYGGIHYPMGNRAGLTQGACVASFVREAKILPTR